MIFRVFMVIALLAVPVTALPTEYISIPKLVRTEKRGIKEYRRGNYKKAFKLLGESASWGLKQSQYYLSFMFLKGQHVPQSTVIGMGWLGVAIEADVDEWSETYTMLYEAASPALKARIDAKVDQYIGQFGAEAQAITCTTVVRLGSRVPVPECFPRPEVVTTRYPVELTE